MMRAITCKNIIFDKFYIECLRSVGIADDFFVFVSEVSFENEVVFQEFSS